MDIERLIALCPRYSKVVLHANTGIDDTYFFASSGDVIVLHECAAGEPTGRTLTALVIAPAGQQTSTALKCTSSEVAKRSSLAVHLSPSAVSTNRADTRVHSIVTEVCPKVSDP